MNLAIHHNEYHVQNKDKNLLHIAFNIKIEKELKGLKVKKLTSYLTSNELQKLDKEAWFYLDKIRKKLDSKFMYKKIPLLDTMQWEFYFYYFRRLFTYIRAMQKIIKKEKPKSITFVDNNDFFCKVLPLVAKKIKLKRIKPKFLKSMQHEYNKIKNMQTFDLYVSKPGIVKTTYNFTFYKRKLLSRLKPFEHEGLKVLFFPNVNNQIDAFETVYKEMMKTPDVHPKIINVDDPMSRVGKKLDASSMDHTSFEDYSPIHIKLIAEKNLRPIKKAWKRQKPIKFDYEGMNIWPIIQDTISYLLFKRKRFNDVVEMIETIESIIKIEKPNIMINIAEYVPLGRALTYTAKNHNIKSVNIPHAMLWYQIENSQVHSDIIITPGRLSKKFLLGAGNPEKKIKITGFPKLDLMYKKKYNKARVYKALGLKPNQKFFTLATNPVSDEENTQLITAVIEAMKDYPNIKLVIKLHPLENGGLHKKLIKEYKYKNAIIIKDINIFELIHASDVLLVYYSTVAVDAVIMNKPVLTINLSSKPDRLPYAEMGIALGVYKKEAVSKAIQDVLKDRTVKDKLKKSRERFIKEYFFKIDGKSGQRAAKAILK